MAAAPDTDRSLRQLVEAVAGTADPAAACQAAVEPLLAACHADTALIARRIGPTDVLEVLARSGGDVLCARALDGANERSRPVTLASTGTTARPHRLAQAMPVDGWGREVGFVAVAGDDRRLVPSALAGVAQVLALALVGREPAPSGDAVLARMAEVVDEPDLRRLPAAVLGGLAEVAGSPAGLLLIEGADGEAAAVLGLDPAAATACVTSGALDLLCTDRLERGLPGMPAVEALAPGGQLLVVPLAHRRVVVARAVLVVPGPLPEQTRHLLGTAARLAAAPLAASATAQRLHAREAQLGAVLEAVRSPVLVLDGTARLAVVNPAAADLLHLPGSWSTGQPADGNLGSTVLEDVATGRRDDEPDVVLGEPARVFRAVARVPRTTSGRVVVLHDVTAERDAERTRDEFVSVIGHELRTPLTILQGFVKTLAKRAADLTPAEQSKVLDALLVDADRLEHLVTRLLFVAGIETPRPRLDGDPVDLGLLLESRARAVPVELVRPPGPLLAVFDERLVGEVLDQLLTNASVHAGGPVAIEAHDRGDELEVVVVDHGPGIWSGDIPALFERFRQLDASSTRSAGGTGIGLHLARRLAELQGRRIWCESRLGVGSRFAFTVPRRPVAATS